MPHPATPHVHHLLILAHELVCRTEWSQPPWQRFFFWDLCVSPELEEKVLVLPRELGCPSESPVWFCSVKWHRQRLPQRQVLAALQPEQQEAHLLLFCTSERGLPPEGTKGTRQAQCRSLLLPVTYQATHPKAFTATSAASLCNLSGNEYTNSDFNLGIHMPYL